MSEFPVFAPSQYAECVARGMTIDDMRNNMQERAQQLGDFLRDAASGGRTWRIPEIAAEAMALRQYRWAWELFLLDAETSPLNEKRPRPWRLMNDVEWECWLAWNQAHSRHFFGYSYIDKDIDR